MALSSRLSNALYLLKFPANQLGHIVVAVSGGGRAFDRIDAPMEISPPCSMSASMDLMRRHCAFCRRAPAWRQKLIDPAVWVGMWCSRVRGGDRCGAGALAASRSVACAGWLPWARRSTRMFPTGPAVGPAGWPQPRPRFLRRSAVAERSATSRSCAASKLFRVLGPTRS